jgi:ubiquinone/menaquinone biosynthesis C-methylase UbiE
MGLQSTKWIQSEADAWHRRNVKKSRFPDPVIEAIKQADIHPETVFEIGCGDGFRLAAMRDKMGCKVWGCDLSKEAIAHGLKVYGDKDLIIGWREAKNLRGVPTEGFDMVIYGFCLYQCDPEELFTIVKEGDRILKDGGHLVVYDFSPDAPHAKAYAHEPILKTRKMDYAALWQAHPAYRLSQKVLFGHEPTDAEITSDNRVAVTILKKDMRNAFPLQP